jgi:Zn-dependent peptidase ImmA (M78 family)
VAHELCHILYDRGYGNSLAIASGPWAPPAVEKRANAFAAMLLMPRSLLRERIAHLARPLTTPEDVASLARGLGVSYTSLLPHLYNVGLMEEETMSALLEQAAPPEG